FSTIAEVFSLLSGANIYPDGNKRSWSISPQQHSKIVVFPNPFGAQFTISGTVEVGQLRVFNAAGQLIHQQQLQPLVEHQIIARNWQPGVYFYRVETPSATTSGKLIRK
ncbi:MAG: T9SS type A sorting domain-containing protein, partial [Gammaproteobacteria bacterium]